MDAFFPSYCSVCYKDIEGVGLYCSEECKEQDSSPRYTRHSHGACKKNLSLNYPSVLSREQRDMQIPIEERYIPELIPELSLSDEDEFSDEGDLIKSIPAEARIYGFAR
ncbi:hypothetical protein DASB73_036650 [Starmerella bacillaris]|uniref:MYND-type domain-containing protein n=1 Tax=Starmerella bacillaris TaxID=1247836 RepID=A0AAV5RP51_STABA|nr:hypothetical protein DASB73_036650 [Starmerella bacillaris]